MAKELVLAVQADTVKDAEAVAVEEYKLAMRHLGRVTASVQFGSGYLVSVVEYKLGKVGG